jgi:hypothetical protein
MRNIRVVLLWVMILVALLLAMPQALAGQKRQHHGKDDVWVGCVKDAPATTLGNALDDAVATGDREGRSCWINHRKGWWIFRRTEKMPIIKSKRKKSAKGPTSSALYPIRSSQSVIQ